MLLTRSALDAGLVYVALLGLLGALLTIVTVPRTFRVERLPVGDAGLLGGASLLSGFLSYVVTMAADAAMLIMLAGTAVILIVRVALPRLTPAGVLATAQVPLLFLFGAPWTYLWLFEAGASTVTLTVAGIMLALSAVMTGFGIAESLARRAVLTHADWRRPLDALPPAGGRGAPKVSVHLPAYAEPPELVIGVLDRLARLDYPNFEVLVCDNNTPDEALWRPLQAHCARLNLALGHERFRFFHVAPLAGAKAGALNFLLDHTARDAELVAVIDADYQARPDFLSRLVGFFDDPRTAYVQTPHDYRDWQDSAYLTGCYWEYMPSNKVELPGVNEYGAAYTIGTMCILRRQALEAAGRWAEWCLTEDSEVSVRLRALGYQGHYLRETFGRGLIPETFDDYKKQRFRWTAGPVQQLRRHWRLYLPRWLGGPSTVRGWSKLLEVQRGAAPTLQAIGTVLGTIAAIGVVALTATGVLPVMDVPDAAWTAMILGIGSGLLATWQRYRLSGCHEVADMLRGEVARLSLTYIQMVGGLAGLSRRPLAWKRTPKFAAESAGLRALASTAPEAAAGAAYLLMLGVVIALSDVIGADLALLLAFGTIGSAVRFLSAPVMAVLSERHLATQARAAAGLADPRAPIRA